MSIPIPVSFWNFDESSGNASDAAGPNNLMNRNSATFVSGVINNCCYLVHSSSQFFSISEASQSGFNVSTGALSFFCWVRVASRTQNNVLLSKWNNGGARQYEFAIVGGNTLEADFTQDGTDGTGFYQHVSWTPTLNTWYHVGFVYDITAKTLKYYVNGSQQGSTQTTGNTSIWTGDTHGNFGIGSRENDTGQSLDGNLDMVGFWHAALSPADITALYNAGLGLQYPFAKPSSCFFLAVAR